MAFQDGITESLTIQRRVGTLPSRLKVLYITTLHRTGGWLAEAFANDSATEITLEESVGATAGLSRLRDEVFDAVLVSHEPGVLDALELIEGLRGGGADEPMIILGTQNPQAIEAECFEVGADAYCCVAQTTTRSLLWQFSRALERHRLVRENRRLAQADRQRLEQEHEEAERLLAQQRVLVAELEQLCSDGAHKNPTGAPVDAGVALDQAPNSSKASWIQVSNGKSLALPDTLVHHYREMLRTYIIMGAGNLSKEMTRLAELLALAGISAGQTMQLHIHVLEELIHGLGNRSAKHVLNRADLLVLEVMVHLAERYRQQYLERTNPPCQLMLPGFNEEFG